MPKKSSVSSESKSVPAPERIASSVKQLAVKSTDIKSAAGDLSQQIAPFDRALAMLDLGVSAWFEFAGNEDNYGNYWLRAIGYAQVGNVWGIALKRDEGNYNSGHDTEEVWLFKDAPLYMQIESVTKLPDLFETLIKRADDTITKLKSKAIQAKELTDALNAALADTAAPKE